MKKHGYPSTASISPPAVSLAPKKSPLGKLNLVPRARAPFRPAATRPRALNLISPQAFWSAADSLGWHQGRGQLRLFAIGLRVRVMRAIVASLPGWHCSYPVPRVTQSPLAFWQAGGYEVREFSPHPRYMVNFA